MTDAAAACGMSWPTAHQAFTGHVGEVLETEPEPVTALGVDETRRGDPVWDFNPVTGVFELVLDQWNIGFVDITAGQGLLGQVNGRTGDDVAYWLGGQSPAWRQRIDYVAIDMCTIFKSAIRRVLPKARIVVDAFHVVQLGNRALDQVRRRAVRKKYGRRGTRFDAENTLISRLRMNREQLPEAEIARIRSVLSGDVYGRMTLAGWDAKELLREVIRLREPISDTAPRPEQVHLAVQVFLDFCHQHRWIPELATLARTVKSWRKEIIYGVLSGISNAMSEGVNRIIKDEQGRACGFRNQDDQQRRNHIAIIRSRLRAQRVTAQRSLIATG